MIAQRLPAVVAGLGLVLACACSGPPKRAPNDEVSAPMNAEDEAAVQPESESGDEGPREADAGP